LNDPEFMNTTPPSLLERVRKQSDQAAWVRFVNLYSPLIYRWARRCGLQAEDASDLTQDVFTILFQKVPHFTYDQQKSFRAWLHTVTLNCWRDRFKRVAQRPLTGNVVPLEALTAPDGIGAMIDSEYRAHLVGRALRLMQEDFQPATWQAFWEHGVNGRGAAEVGSALGLTPAAVYAAKARVLNRLRQELDGLLD
jgi:RNA polymerase sigma-70 factor, ECF subfamily